MKATRKQKELTIEIKEILENEYLNPHEIIKNSEDKDEVDAQLNIAKYRLKELPALTKEVEDYLLYYHQKRPHISLGMRPPLKEETVSH